mmetsp:Transcript_17239/g.31232  ORF Transcript_17239/g.31232 Transcript_17239/m.31232 type:complete len:220 (+) Transcript_17239:1701-2360(+)
MRLSLVEYYVNRAIDNNSTRRMRPPCVSVQDHLGGLLLREHLTKITLIHGNRPGVKNIEVEKRAAPVVVETEVEVVSKGLICRRCLKSPRDMTPREKIIQHPKHQWILRGLPPILPRVDRRCRQEEHHECWEVGSLPNEGNSNSQNPAMRIWSSKQLRELRDHSNLRNLREQHHQRNEWREHSEKKSIQKIHLKLENWKKKLGRSVFRLLPSLMMTFQA